MKKTVIALLLSMSMIMLPLSNTVQAASVSGNRTPDLEAEKEQEDKFSWADDELKAAMEKEFSAGFGGDGQPFLNPEGIYGGEARYIFYGDSCAHGYENEKDGRYIMSYPYYFQQYTNCYIKNMSICGATAGEDYGFNFYNEVKDTEALNSYDVAFFQFGINDFYLSYPLGSVDSDDIDTVCGGLNYSIQKIKDNGVEPICILPFYYKGQATHKVNAQNLTFDDYIAAIKAVCERNQVTIVDFNTAFGMTAENYEAYYIDHVHPDNALQMGAGEYLYHFIQKYGDGRDKIEEFVSRLYERCLNRTGDYDGEKYWQGMLMHNLRTGTEVAYGFVFSDEVKNKNLSDEDFVEMLYEVMMGRASDAAGKADWLYKLANGVGREGVFKGFAHSAEFSNLCNSYGILKGKLEGGEARNQNPNLTVFVSRLYTKALNRTYEVAGLNDWCNRIINGAWSINDVSTTGFFNSDEFYNRNLDDSEYVKTLYRTFFDREYDKAGYDDWMNRLAHGTSRNDVMLGFANSREFADLKKTFGL